MPTKKIATRSTKVTKPKEKKMVSKAKVVAKRAPPPKKQPEKKKAAVAPKARVSAAGGPSGFTPYKEKKGETYMDAEQLAHFLGILESWKKELSDERNATTRSMREDSSSNAPSDPLDRAVVEEERSFEWRTREREHKLISKIDQALMRIKQGDYGFCEGCGAEIGVRRLEARPTATQCIDCKTFDEIRERQTGTVE